MANFNLTDIENITKEVCKHVHKVVDQIEIVLGFNELENYEIIEDGDFIGPHIMNSMRKRPTSVLSCEWILRHDKKLLHDFLNLCNYSKGTSIDCLNWKGISDDEGRSTLRTFFPLFKKEWVSNWEKVNCHENDRQAYEKKFLFAKILYSYGLIVLLRPDNRIPCRPPPLFVPHNDGDIMLAPNWREIRNRRKMEALEEVKTLHASLPEKEVIEDKLKILREKGFEDDRFNLIMLQLVNYNVEECLSDLKKYYNM